MTLLEARRSKSAAPGQYLGFSLQQIRLCDYLLWVSDGTSVSLEHADDVAVHRSDGSILLEQAKSALSGNPLGNRSEELWKTFANWAERVADGLDAATTDFQLYVCPIKTGELVTALHEASSVEAATVALTRVKALVNVKKPTVGCNPYVAKFLSAGDDNCLRIIRRFRLVTEEDPVESIRQRFRATLRAQSLDDFCATAIGMARDHAERFIRANAAAIVSASDFRKQFHAFVRKYDLLGLLPSSVPLPTADVISALVNTAPVFVRQLEAVQASSDLLVTAVSDYLRTESDKVNWADEGLILTDSLNELDGQLERQHSISRDEIEDTLSSQSEEQRGRALYRNCIETKLPLEGRALPSHFIAGAFNCLADSRRLGWHPHYKALFPVE